MIIRLHEPDYAVPKTMSAPRRFMFIFCGRGKVGGGNNRLLGDDSFELCLAEQRFSVPYVTFCIVLLLVRPSGC